MTIWYHPRFHLLGQLYSRPVHQPLYWSNVAIYRLYVSESLAFPLKKRPSKCGWVKIGEL